LERIFAARKNRPVFMMMLWHSAKRRSVKVYHDTDTRKPKSQIKTCLYIGTTLVFLTKSHLGEQLLYNFHSTIINIKNIKHLRA
jgi:hypothetical protein